jgi:hypothetical protein
MPMTFGTLHPRILLPPEAAAWTTEKRRLVLLHETAHIVRLDVLTHTLAGFVRALYWFHPLIWLAHWQMALEAERAADDRVLLATNESVTYARTLIEVAAGLHQKPTLLGGIAMARKSTLEARIRSVMRERANRRGVGTLHVLAAALLALGVGLPLGMLRAVSTEDPKTTPPLDAARDASAVQHFSNGETIELLGITHDQQGPWWRVDGGPMVPPLGVTGSRDMSEDNVYLLRMTGVPQGSDPVADAQDQRELQRLRKIDVVATDGTYYTVSQNRQLPTLCIGSSKGEWKTEIETHWGESSKIAAGQIAVGQPRTWKDPAPQTDVYIAYTFDPRQVDWRLVAVDTQGKEHYATREGTPASLPPLRQEQLLFAGLAAADVKSLRFETRPREWIQFEGFIVNPGMPNAADRLPSAQLVKLLQAKRAAEMEAAKTAKTEAVTLHEATPPANNFYYVIGGSRPGIYQLGPQSLTVLQAVVSSGVTQSDLSAIRIEVVRQKDGKSQTPVDATLNTILHGNDAKLQSGDVIWIKDLSDLRQKEAALETSLEQLSDLIQHTSDPAVLKDLQPRLAQGQAKLQDLKAHENDQ